MSELRQEVQHVCHELFSNNLESMAEYAEQYLLARLKGQPVAQPSADFDVRLSGIIGQADALEWWASALEILRGPLMAKAARYLAGRPGPQPVPPGPRHIFLAFAQALAGGGRNSVLVRRCDKMLCHCGYEHEMTVAGQVMGAMVHGDEAVQRRWMALMASWVEFNVAYDFEEPYTELRNPGWWNDLSQGFSLKNHMHLIPLMLEHLRDSRPQCRWLAVSVLEQIEAGEEQWARPMLEVLAKDTEPSVRCAAVDALVAVVGRVPDASSAVLRVLADAHETHSVRLAAIMAAPKLGDASEAAVASLVRWLREPPAGLDGRQWLHTRERAAWSLGIIARQPQTAVPALLDVVCDEQSYMTPGNLRLRTWAADAIGDFGPAAAFAAEPLVKFLRRQPDLYLSDAIMRTLGCIAASEGIDELLLLLRSCPIAEVRGMAVGGLGHVAERVPAAREALIAAMSGDTDASVRESAVSVSTRFCPRGKGFQ